MMQFSQVQRSVAALFAAVLFAGSMALSGCGVDTISGPDEAGPTEQYSTTGSTSGPPSPHNDDCEGAGGCG